MTRLPKSSNVSHTSPRTMVYLQIRSSGMPPSLLPSLCPNLVTLDGAMSPIVNLPQDKPACDQYIHAFIPRNVITSNIYSSTIARPRARRDSSTPVVIGKVWGPLAFLLLLVALTYFLWKVRQGRVHSECINLANLVLRRRRAQQSPASVTDRRMKHRVSSQAYNPETALPWSLLRNYRPTPAPTAPAISTLPLKYMSGTILETPTLPESARVAGPRLLQEPYRPVVLSPNLNAHSNSSSPILHTPPPSWRSLSPRPPAYEPSDQSDLRTSSPGH